MSRFTGKRKGVIRMAGNAEAEAIFAGKTLNEVGFTNELGDEDITISTGLLPDGKTQVKTLLVTVKGVTYACPLSRSFPADKMNDADFLLDCMFRKSFASIKEEDGFTAKTDSEGAVMLDQSKAYMSFGKPDGITYDNQEVLFKTTSTDKKKAAGALA